MTTLPSKEPMFSKPALVYLILIVVSALGISIVDGLFPLGVSIGEAYTILVLLGFMAKDKRLILGGAITGTILTLEPFPKTRTN